MKKPAWLALFATLALTACGSTAPTSTLETAPAADVQEDEALDTADALTTASRTVTLTPAQARALGMDAQATREPLTATVAVKIGKAGTKYAGQKRAYLSWKIAGNGNHTATYTLSLTDGQRVQKLASGKDATKTGSVSLTLPTPTGKDYSTRSRSTSYSPTTAPSCAVAVFSWQHANGTTYTQEASGPTLTVCEPGTQQPSTPTPSAPTPHVQLETRTLTPTTGSIKGVIFDVQAAPTGATWSVQPSQECGAEDGPVSASGSLSPWSPLFPEQDVNTVFISPEVTIPATRADLVTVTVQTEQGEFRVRDCLAVHPIEDTRVYAYWTDTSAQLGGSSIRPQTVAAPTENPDAVDVQVTSLPEGAEIVDAVYSVQALRQCGAAADGPVTASGSLPRVMNDWQGAALFRVYPLNYAEMQTNRAAVTYSLKVTADGFTRSFSGVVCPNYSAPQPM